ncbi:MAG TPA: hypothetical protein VFS62_17870 [Chloroflexota bacterium]|jgi:hypothetical protein|nr:hypothetical protein [Chloroflexota bacterium]
MLLALSVLLVPAAAFTGVLRQWRLCLASLGVLYLLVGAIEGVSVSPVIGVCQLIVGGTALAVLFLGAQQIFSQTNDPMIHGRLPAWEYAFETVVAVVAAVGAALFAHAHPLFGLAAPISFAWAWLGLAGLFMVVLATNILEQTLGLLVFVTGMNLLILATSAGDWWLALVVVQLLPIALALLMSVAGIRLSHFGHAVTLDVLMDKAPFVVSRAGPVRIRVRRRGGSTTPVRRSATTL